MVSFRCCDCGLDCSFETQSHYPHELTAQVIDHIHSDHSIEVIPPELMLNLKNAIRK